MQTNQLFCKHLVLTRPRSFCLRKLLFFLCGVMLCSVLVLPVKGLASSKKPATLIDKQYRQAKAYYQNLLNTKRGHSRKNWLTGVQAFRKIYKANPDHPLAPSCLFMLGRLYYEMHERSNNPLDLGESVAYYEDVVSLFPKHGLADDALYATGLIYLRDKEALEKASSTFAKIVAIYPDGDMAKSAANQLHKLKGPSFDTGSSEQKIITANSDMGLSESIGTDQSQPENCATAEVRPIRYWSNNNYTRVVIETSSQVKFKKYVLAQHGKRPRRLYVDLINCRISPNVQNNIPIQDGLLRQVRNAQFAPNIVRVVLDTQSNITDHKIFSLEDPFRVVIDVSGSKNKTGSTDNTDNNSPSLAQQLGLGIKRIVLDPGHGGKDPGTIGPKGLKEKDIVLRVAKKLAPIIRKKIGCEVILTRDRDVFVPLEERTAIANSREGDLFISIHVNAAPSRNTKGIETYVLDLATNKDAMRVAALENATSSRQLSDLQSILMDLIQNSNINESVKLAEYVQDSMVTGLNRQYRGVNNLGVKKAPFIVLIGAQMPAILTEIAFLSNPDEAKRLQSDKYLNSIADQISGGVSRYINTLNLAGLFDE